jgi:hypothetical protein
LALRRDAACLDGAQDGRSVDAGSGSGGHQVVTSVAPCCSEHGGDVARGLVNERLNWQGEVPVRRWGPEPSREAPSWSRYEW